MKSLMKALTPNQQLWFANLVIHAVWADGRIALSEFENFQRLLSLLKSFEQKQDLLQRLENHQVEAVTLLPDLDPSLLPIVYLEVLNFAICDWDLAQEEQDFLSELADIFHFDQVYQASVMQWAQEGMRWQEDQQLLLPRDLSLTEPRFSVDQLNEHQKRWYAEVLISSVMIEGLEGEVEVSLLQKALDFVEDPLVKQQLLAYVRANQSPILVTPVNIPPLIVYQALFEVLQVFTLSDELSARGVEYIGTYIEVCNLAPGLKERAILWCTKGILWRKKRKDLNPATYAQS